MDMAAPRGAAVHVVLFRTLNDANNFRKKL